MPRTGSLRKSNGGFPEAVGARPHAVIKIPELVGISVKQMMGLTSISIEYFEAVRSMRNVRESLDTMPLA